MKICVCVFSLFVAGSIWKATVPMRGAVGPADPATSGILDLRHCGNGVYGAAISAVRQVDAAFDGQDLASVETLVPQTLTKIARSLACAPVSSDLWLASARLRAFTDGLSPQVVSDLEMACRTGPTQSWSASARLKGFAPIQSALPASLQACLDRDRRIAAVQPRFPSYLRENAIRAGKRRSGY
ncbi:hypothetical protein ASG48_07250 [Aurantimonas sp. Leaf443]|nr:hypothetical protein ASG48_07250 [Aurantimonas sp. Leaf443]